MKKIKSLELKNFRGYAGNKTYELEQDKNIVLLFGRNGTGKTSFFDAIEWGMTGFLERYNDKSKEAKEYVILRNKFSKSQKGFVKINFDDESYIKRDIIQKSKTDHNEGKIEKIGINNIKNENFNYTHLLSQELISSFIRNTKDTERYKIFTRLFGLEQAENYRIKIKEVTSELSKERDNNKQKLEKIELNLKNLNLELKLVDNSPEKILNQIKYLSSQSQELQANLNTKLQTEEEIKSAILKIQEDLIKINSLYSSCNKYYENKQKIKKYKENYENLIKIEELYKIEKLKDSYLEYFKNQEKLGNLKSELEKLILKENNFFKSKTLIDKFESLEIESNNYEILINEILIKEKEESELKKEIEFYRGIKVEFLNKTLNFLKNTEVSNCPICSSEINVIEKIDSLEKELEDIETPKTRELILKLEKTTNLIKEQIERKSEYEILISKKINENKIKIRENQNQIEHIEKNKNNFDAVDRFLKIENITFYELKEMLEKESLNLKNFNIHEKSKISNKIEELESSITKIENELMLYKISIENYKLNFLIEKIENLTYYKNNFELYLKCLENLNKEEMKLSKYSKYANLKEKILNLQKEKENLYNKQIKIENLFNIHEKWKNFSKEKLFSEFEKITNSSFETIQKIYTFLNPSINFSKIEGKIDKENSVNARLIFEISDGNDDIKLNPSYIFSSAQNNLIAISIFLTFALTQKSSDYNFILLDDPIQNMDDINIHGFIDLLRIISCQLDKQIILSTHDERLMKFFEYKFRNNLQLFELDELVNI